MEFATMQFQPKEAEYNVLPIAEASARHRVRT